MTKPTKKQIKDLKDKGWLFIGSRTFRREKGKGFEYKQVDEIE